MKKNQELCPGCRKGILRNEDRIVAGGKEWHRPCYEKTQLEHSLKDNRIDEKKIRSLVQDVEDKLEGTKNESWLEAKNGIKDAMTPRLHHNPHRHL